MSRRFYSTIEAAGRCPEPPVMQDNDIYIGPPPYNIDICYIETTVTL